MSASQPNDPGDPTMVVGKLSLSDDAVDSTNAPLFAMVRRRKINLCLLPEEGDPLTDPFVLVRLRPGDNSQKIVERVEILFL